MSECDYKGYIDIEYENSDYPAAEAVKKAIDYLRNIESRI
jgi:sugar phosphate isomerase/epimerase